MKTSLPKSVVIGLMVILSGTVALSQSAANTWSVKFSDALISRYQPNINTLTGKGWEYSNSIILHGMELVYGRVATPAYLSYIQTYVDAYVNSSGAITGMAESLDRIHPGLLCLFLYQQTGLTKYKTAATYLRNYLMGAASTYHKTPNGGYWHKNNGSYNNVMMADGIYMAHPFLVKYGQMFNDPACYDTATNQALLLAGYLYDGTSHLFRHAWDYDKNTYAWSNPATGISSEVWSRGMGWYVMALVDMLRYLPNTHPHYNTIKTLLSNICIGIQNNQDPVTGLWYQVVDKGGQSGNYLETSGSAMFVYALKVAADSGWISSSYLAVAQKGWAGLKANSISTYSGDGKPEIDNYAPAMSVQNNYAGYVGVVAVNTPASANPHGYAAILMAASVMEFPLISLPVEFASFSVRSLQQNVQVSWTVGAESGLFAYQVEKSENGIDFKVIGTQLPNGGPHYSWMDLQPGIKKAFYRVRALGEDGSVLFSRVKEWVFKEEGPAFSVVPNPAEGGRITLRMANALAGDYRCLVRNAVGAKLMEKTLHFENGNSEQVLDLPRKVNGQCYIQLQGPDGNIQTREILMRQ